MGEHLNPGTSLPRAVAIDLGGTNLRGAVVDSDGRFLSRRSEKTASSRKAGDVVDQIQKMIISLVSDGESGNKPIRGIGLGIPGFVDYDTDVVVHSPNFPTWHDFPLGKHVAKELSYPVLIENDANCFLLGEWWKGVVKGCENVLGFTLGTGVGGGAMVQGRLLQGAHGGAGEFGHICVDPKGRPCGCGGTGCLEQYASGEALEKYTNQTAEAWFEQAQKGNKDALKVFSDVGWALGIALTSLGYALDPDKVVIGGKLAQAYPYFKEALREELNRRLANHPAKNMKVVPTENNEDSALLGAARIVFDRMPSEKA